MRIAFLSSLDPRDTRSWSGTLYHMYSMLQSDNEVEWVGGDIIREKRQLHSVSLSGYTFMPELYVDYWAIVLEDYFKHRHYDIIYARDYYFIAKLDVDIPIVYVGDTTSALMSDYLRYSEKFADYADQIELLAIENATKVIYSSEWAARSAIDYYGANPNKVHVVEFGANLLDGEPPTSLPIYKDCCNILFVARTWESKGGLIIEEACRVWDELGFNYKLTVIGCSPNIASPHIEVLGFLDKSEEQALSLLRRKYQEANFFLMPTRFDCFGIVYAEAASYGIPSLASDIGGVSQVIKDGVNGFLFDYEDRGDVYAHKIISLYQDQSAYEALCRTTRKDAEERLSWKVWKNKVSKILLSCIDSKEHPKPQYSIPTYIINRKVREDRRVHILKEFEGRPEFSINLIEACEHPIGAVGLWNSIRKVIQDALDNGHQKIVICEDDHYFTQDYTSEYLFSNILRAEQQGALILNGGIGGFGVTIPVSPNRYWVDWFWCTQFIIVYRPLFKQILDYQFKPDDTADGVLSAMTPYKMVLYPFVSEQATFGYSDITEGNKNNPNLIREHFARTKKRLGYLHAVATHFRLR